ncbi:hypothetical protein [Microtetraspora sp. NBRC 16547]|uniref:hypothetical protein n=1 Tax=Microtetraspora sp. NBRC 16547 TaxID=3030993 RepID=UPI00255343F0|nr:hypothetical protein [Microtetraspora sp. NBRC 16547]
MCYADLASAVDDISAFRRPSGLLDAGRVIPETMALLRDALTEAGVVTYDADVTISGSGVAVLSIAQGVVVRIDDRWIGWPTTARRWQVHPARQPRRAARLLAVQLGGDPFLRLRMEFPGWSILRIAEGQICAVPMAPALPAVETYSVDDLAVRLRAIEEGQRC